MLTKEDYERAAKALGVPVAAIRAVDEVESLGEGMLATGEPKILFERHYFRRLTGGKFSAKYPDLSGQYKPGTYGPASKQHARLAAAAKLDRDAALKSASWGRFQIMGENHNQAGHATIQSFINAMYAGDPAHLDSFVSFIMNDKRLLKAIRAMDWKTFARIYNGPSYASNQYDVKLAKAYSKWSTS